MTPTLEDLRKHLLGGGTLAGYPGKVLKPFREKYSHFEDKVDKGFVVGSRHVVTALATPKPYLHLMTGLHDKNRGHVGSFCDSLGYGFCCINTVLAGKITSHKDPSYVPTAPRHPDFRGLYLREGKKIWSLIPQPSSGVSEKKCGYRCEQGLGFIRMSAEQNGVHAQFELYVPADETGEVWRVVLTNTTAKARKIAFFADVTWGLESYPGDYFDPRVVSVGEYHPELKALRALNMDQNNRHPRTGLMIASRPFSHYDLAYEAYHGSRPRNQWPDVVVQGRCTDSMGAQPLYGLIGAMQFDLALRKKKSEEFEFFVGNTAQNKSESLQHIENLRKTVFGKNGRAEFKKVKSGWEAFVRRAIVRTPDREIDRFYNVWSKYQAYNTSRWTRALDKVGYRDLLQDLMSIAGFNPEAIPPFLREALSHQLEDGRAIRQYSIFPGSAHDERMYMDSPLWILDTLVSYLKETGDFAFLKEEIPFYDPSNHRLTAAKSSVYDHAKRAVASLWNFRGQKGLCKIGHGDWNDSLDGIGKKGEGVSVWLSVGLIFAAQQLRELAQFLNDGDTVRFADEVVSGMTGAVNRHAWDGRHYIHAFDDEGRPVGASENQEGTVQLNVNAWALFTGVADAAGRREAVLGAIAKLDTSLGHLLLSPPYTSASKSVGRIADIVPGQFENGSIYTHGQSFVIYGKLHLRMAHAALKDIKKTFPSHTLPDISTSPLHQQTNYTVGPSHPEFGKHLYDNFTGSLAWYRKALDRMFGLLADFDSLVIDPVLPPEWKTVEVVKAWRGREYRAKIENDGGKIRSVTAGGKNVAPRDGVYRINRGEEKTVEIRIVM